MTTSPTTRRWTPEERARIAQRVLAGEPYRAIGADYGVSHQRIYQVVGPLVTANALSARAFADRYGFSVILVRHLARAVMGRHSGKHRLTPDIIRRMAEHPLVALLPTWDDHPDLPPARYLTIATIARRTGFTHRGARAAIQRVAPTSSILLHHRRIYPASVVAAIGRPHRGRRPVLDDATVRVIAERRQAGEPVTSLARHYHVGIKTIYRALRRAATTA